jgi:tetratricopeptide (TPR) repeat protein
LNDILSRSLLIKTFKEDSIALSKYADAELLKFQKKETEAAEVYHEICIGNGKLKSLSGREAAKLHIKLKQFDRAQEILIHMYKELPNDRDFDEILFLLAESEEGLGNYRKAIEAYHELMLSYPNSLYIQSTREKARALNEKLVQEQT